MRTTRWLAAAALLLMGLGWARGEERQPATQAGRDQLDAERRAMRLVARPDVQAALPALEAEWKAGTPGLLPDTLARLHASLAEVLFMVALEVVDGDPRRPRVVEISAPPHRWFGTDVPGGRWGIDNPDTLYFTIPVEPGSRYVITGHRRAPGPVDSNFTVQTPDVWGAVGNIGQRDLVVGADGTFTITVDGEPADGRPNHLQVKGGGTAVLVRNTLGDWSRDTVDGIEVRRVGGPAPGPEPSDDDLARALVARMPRVVAHSVDDLQPPIFRQPANLLPQPGELADKPGFLVTQRNALGHFRLGPDEAIVATFDPGGAGYATFPVTDVWGVSPDYRTHQNSLNTSQAAANPDGSVTVVMSAWDPGVSNWIDTAGLAEGIVMLRWQMLSRASAASGGPGVVANVVARGALAGALPPGLERVTPAERDAQRAARAAGFARRFEDRFP